jgi:hypothetical protein
MANIGGPEELFCGYDTKQTSAYMIGTFLIGTDSKK